MPHALLLSPDDQAVSAISGVLEEMSVTCERPLDGVTAAQKLNSETFDLVLVDCENLPAAKLIFDVCRRGKGGNNPVPIAIVDGRAGLPTAFRLGAELILTKPVAKDQARSTIRTAVGRLRKELPTSEIAGSQQAAGSVTDEQAQAAAASSQAASYADAAPRFARGEVPPSYLTAALTASGFAADAKTTKMSAVADEEAADSLSNSRSSSTSSPSATEFEEESSYRDDSSKDEDSMNTMNGQTTNLPKANDDLVLAEIDRAEKEKSVQPNPQRLGLATSASNSTRPYQRGGKQAHAALIAALMLTIAGGAFYGAWMYQPGFREIAQPQVDRLLNLAAKGLPPASKPHPAKRSAQIAIAPIVAPAAQFASVPNSVAQTPAPNPATNAVTPSTAAAPTSAGASAPTAATTSASANVPVRPTAAPGVAVVPPAQAAKSAPSPVVAQLGAVKSVSPTNERKETKKDVAAPPSADTPLPGENTALILSSRGAEKRLAHSVPPNFPADASKSGAQGPVVLKTVIDENGDVAGVRLVNGNAALAPAAIQAVKQWRYRPYVRDGKALPFQTVVIINSQHP